MRRALALAAAVGFGFLTSDSAAAAQPAIVDVGWWTRLPTESAPEGGFAVGSAPDGPVSVAALRVDVGNGVTQLTIAAPEDAAQNPAAVRICLAEDDWEAASGGPLADRPMTDCTTSVVFEEADGTWRADVAPLVGSRTGLVSVGIVADGPANDPLGITPSSVSYGPPTIESARAVPSTARSTTSPSTTSPQTTIPAPPPTPGPVVALPPTTVLASPAPPTTEVSVGPAPTTTVAVAVQNEVAAPIRSSSGSDDENRAAEALRLVLISAAVGVAVAGVHRRRLLHA